MEKYDVSVIIAVYNTEKFIDECMESLINQDYSFEKIEVLLINDGSKDESLKVCKKYADTYENVKVIDKENGGVSSARNAGLKVAQGKYIMILDSDDFLSSKSIKNLVSFMEHNDCDIASSKIMEYKDGAIKDHIRNQFFTNGTMVYDVNKYPYISQTTVNVIFKNLYENNYLYDESMHSAEDEKLNTEIIMKRQKLGYVENAIYYYRKHSDSQASQQLKNPLFCFDSIINNYTNLFQKYEEECGAVPRYIQGLFLYAIRWRIVGDLIFPYYKEGKEYDDAINQVKNLFLKLDDDLISNCPKMDKYHKLYLLQFKGSKIDTVVEKNHFSVLVNGNVIDDDNTITLRLNRFKIRNSRIYLLGYIRASILLFKKPLFYYETVDRFGNKKRIQIKNLFDSVHKFYNSKVDIAKIYGFELEISLDNLKNLNFEVEIDDQIYPCKFEFSSFTPFRKRIRSYICEKKIIKAAKKGIVFKNANIINRFLVSIPRTALLLLRKRSALKSRREAKKYRNQEIWLYCDRKGIYDNAYFQFQHDIEKNDGIQRFYVVDEKLEENNNLFTKQQMKNNVILKNSKKNINLYLACSKIITSFSSVNEYSPIPLKEFRFYNDIVKYDLIYLQHGVLYANLLKMYSKEHTEIEKIIISSKFEKKNLIENYNYAEKDLILTGMPRFEKEKEKVEKKPKILLAPSWRAYLIQDPPVNGVRQPLTDYFLSSSFFKEINNIINDTKLNQLLKESNVTLDLKLHPIFNVYLDCFKTNCSNINVVTSKVKEEEYSLFITDFSSYQFDFARMKTPIIYFLPDKKEFKAGLHTYRKLDLPLEDAFGDVTYTSQELSKCIQYYLKNNFKLKDIYLKRMDTFFVKNKNIMDEIYHQIRG